MLNNWINRGKWEKIFPYIVIIIGLMQGLIYVFLIPPWQHYDEPGHFEYAWMIANHDSFPQKGEYDNEIRLKILESMKRNDFFNSPSLQELSTVAHTYDPVWIGITQVGDPPLYYVLTAVPLWVLKNASVEVQLYAARFVSLILFLLVIFFAERFAKEVDPKKKYFYYLFPISLVLVPAFVEHSVAMNNDVLATLVYSMIIYYGYRLIQQGINLKLSIVLVGLIGLSVLTKASIWLSIFLIPLGFYFAFFQKKKKPLLGLGILFVIFFTVLIGFFRLDDAAFWFRNTSQKEPTRIATDQGYALQIVNQPGENDNKLIQFIDSSWISDQSLESDVVTIGAWMWADKPLIVNSPSIMILNGVEKTFLKNKSISITSSPNFYVLHYDISPKYDRLFLVLDPIIEKNESVKVTYKDVIFVEGEFSGSILPKFEQNSSEVFWNGILIKNYVRNRSGENKWPRFKPEIQSIFHKIDYRISEAANWIIFTLDTKATLWYTKNSTENLFRSFWAKFGWGHILLEGNKPYRILKIFSLVGFLLFFGAVFKKKSLENLNIITWLIIVVCSNLFYAWFTGISMRAYFDYPSYPDSRYLFSSVYILMGMIVYGWTYFMSKVTNRMKYLIIAAYLIFFVSVNIKSIMTIINYYYV